LETKHLNLDAVNMTWLLAYKEAAEEQIADWEKKATDSWFSKES
jgi:hypothetical protein